MTYPNCHPISLIELLSKLNPCFHRKLKILLFMM